MAAKASFHDLDENDQAILRCIVAETLRTTGASNVGDLCEQFRVSPEQFWEAICKVAEPLGVPACRFPLFIRVPE